MTLAELFRKHGSDKEADSGTAGHCYAAVYERLLAGKRLSVTQVLEIGVFGGGSLRAWRDWFPNAEVHGIDINRDKLFRGLDQRIISSRDGLIAGIQFDERIRNLAIFVVCVFKHEAGSEGGRC